MTGARRVGAVLATALTGAATTAAAQDYVLSVDGHGMREYYCQTEVTLENLTDANLMEISGHLFLYIGGEQVGRSKGTWFMNVAPGGAATATFETPNAPCAEADRIEFVVGACRIAGPGFDDKAACADRIGTASPRLTVATGA